MTKRKMRLNIFIPGMMRKIYSIVLAVVFVAVAGMWLVPRISALYHQIQGSRLLQEVLDSDPEIKSDNIPCAQLPITNVAARTKLVQAITRLKKAASYNPHLAQASLLLGRAYCLVGENENAIEAYRSYTYMFPGNPLGHLELGFAYESFCKDNKRTYSLATNQDLDTVFCQDEELIAHITSSWEAAGINAEQMFLRADMAFAAKQYTESITWFQRATLLGGKPDAYRQFRWAMSNVLTDQPLSKVLDTSVVPVYPISENLKINGSNLQWMRPEDAEWLIHNGERLSVYPTSDTTIGAMWYQGSAGVIVQVPCSSTYLITVRAKHSSSTGQAGELMIEKDLSPVGKFSIKGDWQELEEETNLIEGTHFISVHYLQDIGDAFIQWMQINPVTNCRS